MSRFISLYQHFRPKRFCQFVNFYIFMWNIPYFKLKMTVQLQILRVRIGSLKNSRGQSLYTQVKWTPLSSLTVYMYHKFVFFVSQPDQLTNVHCLFTYDEEVKITQGTIKSSNLVCEQIKFEFNDSSLPIVTASFQVSTGKNNVLLDNPQNIKSKLCL